MYISRELHSWMKCLTSCIVLLFGQIIEKLSPTSPSGEARLKMLKEIAREYSLNWDSSATEAEFMKSHEDLLVPFSGPRYSNLRES